MEGMNFFDTEQKLFEAIQPYKMDVSYELSLLECSFSSKCIVLVIKGESFCSKKFSLTIHKTENCYFGSFCRIFCREKRLYQALIKLSVRNTHLLHFQFQESLSYLSC